MAIKHAFTSAKSDGADATLIQPSNWNAGHVIDAGTAILDFGAFPGSSDASVNVTGQTGIVESSVVEAWIRVANSADHSADEHRIETIEIRAGNVVAGVGFTIYGHNSNNLSEPDASPFNSNRHGPTGKSRPELGGKGTRLWGAWSVQWRWM